MISHIWSHFIKAVVLYNMKEIVTSIWKIRKLSYHLNESFWGDFCNYNIVFSLALARWMAIIINMFFFFYLHPKCHVTYIQTQSLEEASWITKLGTKIVSNYILASWSSHHISVHTMLPWDHTEQNLLLSFHWTHPAPKCQGDVWIGLWIRKIVLRYSSQDRRREFLRKECS